MSLADLTVPNNYNLQCNNLTTASQSAAQVSATGTSNQIVLNSGTHKTIINCPGVVGSTQTLAIPDSGLTASNFLLADNVLGSQNVNIPLNVTSTTNQLNLGAATHFTTLNSVAPAAASQVLNINDSGIAACDIALGKARIVTANASRALLTSESGATIGIDASGGAVALTLPAISSANMGLKYRIFWKVAGTSSTVASAAANGLNGIIINAATSVLTNPSNKQTLTFVSGTAHLDDFIELEQGVQAWQFKAFTTVNGGITIA